MAAAGPMLKLGSIGRGQPGCPLPSCVSSGVGSDRARSSAGPELPLGKGPTLPISGAVIKTQRNGDNQ